MSDDERFAFGASSVLAIKYVVRTKDGYVHHDEYSTLGDAVADAFAISTLGPSGDTYHAAVQLTVLPEAVPSLCRPTAVEVETAREVLERLATFGPAEEP